MTLPNIDELIEKGWAEARLIREHVPNVDSSHRVVAGVLHAEFLEQCSIALSTLQEQKRKLEEALRSKRGGWCWEEGDPEFTWPDPVEWADYAGPFTDRPFIQRFDWGMPAPSSWLVVHDTEEGSIREEYESEEEAKARLSALLSGAGE